MARRFQREAITRRGKSQEQESHSGEIILMSPVATGSCRTRTLHIVLDVIHKGANVASFIV